LNAKEGIFANWGRNEIGKGQLKETLEMCFADNEKLKYAKFLLDHTDLYSQRGYLLT
jgi:hypothetical protein